MTQNLTKEMFVEKVFDFENEKEWKFKGNKPAIIDFYADWCQPCKMIAPILEEISVEYEGKIDVYKVNTENENELSSMFGIRSIPSVLFVPLDSKPQMTAGAMPKDGFIQIIKDVFDIK